MNNKQVIRINENQLKHIVSESVKRAINELGRNIKKPDGVPLISQKELEEIMSECNWYYAYGRKKYEYWPRQDHNLIAVYIAPDYTKMQESVYEKERRGELQTCRSYIAKKCKKIWENNLLKALNASSNGIRLIETNDTEQPYWGVKVYIVLIPIVKDESEVIHLSYKSPEWNFWSFCLAGGLYCSTSAGYGRRGWSRNSPCHSL